MSDARSSGELPFVGRVAQLDALRSALARGDRLLTITGTAGIGKTRVARRLVDSSDVPHHFCDLTETADGSAFCATVAGVLGVPLGDAPSQEEAVGRVGAHLHSLGDQLVVLDNLEQVAQTCVPIVETWLRSSPQTRFVVTSRARLSSRLEVVFELPPLGLPDGEEPSEAVELLLDCARRVGGRVDGAEAEIAELARRLDGIPLALELAASRLDVLTPAALLERLEDRFAVLRRAGEDRHASLAGALAQSWELLAPWERTVLAQCSVFRGGFDLEAVEAVTDLSAHPKAPPPLDVMQSLRRSSLVLLVPRGGVGLFTLFLSVRELAAEKLDAMGGIANTEARHADHYVETGEREHRALAAGVGSGRAHLEAMRDNLLAVVHRARTGVPGVTPAHAMRAAVAIDPVLRQSWPEDVRRELVERAFDLAERAAVPEPVVAAALRVRAYVFRRRGLDADAARDIEQAIELCRRVGADELERRLFVDFALFSDVSLTNARAELVDALERHRDVDDPSFEGIVLFQLARNARDEGRAEEAARRSEGAHRAARRAAGPVEEQLRLLAFCVEECIDEGRWLEGLSYTDRLEALARDVGDHARAGQTRLVRGSLLHGRGDLDAGLEQFDLAIAELSASHWKRMVSNARAYRALLLRSRGELAEARDELSHDLLMPEHYIACFTAVRAGIGAMLGDVDGARAVFRRAEQAFERTGAGGLETVLQTELAHLDLAHARDAAEDDRPEDVQRALADAERRLAHAREAPRSFELRLSIEELEVALERARDDYAPLPSPDAGRLVVHRGGEWIQLPTGERIDCRKRRVLRALLAALAESHGADPKRVVSRASMFRAGWPAETDVGPRARNRLHQAVNSLRALGLGDALETVGEGYRLRPDAGTRVAS